MWVTGMIHSILVMCMNKRYGIMVSLLMAILISLPLISSGNGGSAEIIPPSRYGFTYDFEPVANPAPELISVATGDLDGRNNDDIAVGANGQIITYINNGGTGANLGFTLYRTITLTGYHITDIEIVDYDGDSDLDIIALGQEYYYMSNNQGGAGPTTGNIAVFFIENTGTGFSVEATYTASDALYANSNWKQWDGKFDLTTGDFDNDGDIDAAIIYGADTTGNNQADRLRVTAIYFDQGTLSSTHLYNEAPPGTWTWGFLQAADMDEDGWADIVFCQVLDTIHILWNSVGTFDSALEIAKLPELTNAARVPYALAVGHFAGDVLLDIIVSTNDSPDYWNSHGQIYTIRQQPRTAGRNTFGSPELAYGEGGNFNFFRGFAVGRLNNETSNHGDDVVTFTKQDSDRVAAPDEIEGFGITVLKSQTASPKKLSLMKLYSPEVVDKDNLNAIALGNFDNDPEGYDDLVFVGSDITVGTLSYPPDRMPVLKDVIQSPSPVLNNNLQTASVNISVEDYDGSWDLDKIEVDLTAIEGFEGRIVTVPEPTYKDPENRTIGFYQFNLNVPPEVPGGNHPVELRIYGKGPVKDEPKTVTSFILRVAQFNRAPIINFTQTQLDIMEDVPATFEGVYNWFIDQDGDRMEIKIKNPFVPDSFMTSLNTTMFLAELINFTESNPYQMALRITPKPNVHHDEYGGGGPNAVVLRAFDHKLKSDELALTIRIWPVNDIATIPPQGYPVGRTDFAYLLNQDRKGFTVFRATDPLDGDPEGKNLRYHFIYHDPTDEEWLIIEPEGKILWDPKNEHVGPHRVTIVVNDSYHLIERVLWFNVSNVVDPPFFVSISNQTTTFDLIANPPSGRLDFTVYEHEELRLTVLADDIDRWIGYQDHVIFQCNLTVVNNTFLDVDPDDPFKATLRFWARLRDGYPATYEPDFPPVETEILIVDPYDTDIVISLPIRITIINVNDPPLQVTIDSPEEGTHFPILYNHLFVAGTAVDPDTIYGDHLRYIWDFDARDGFEEDANGTSVRWDFPNAGDYVVTLRVYDSGDLYSEATVNVTVSGIRNDTDWDNDGMPNDWEIQHGLNPYDPLDAHLDKDGDGLSNLEEYLLGTDPNKRDTDGDGIDDLNDYDPLDPNIWEPPQEEEGWFDNPLNILLLIIIISVILILIIIVVTVYVIMARKRAEKEEEKRKQAEEMQKSMYEEQDLYTNLPALQQEATAEEVQAPALPPTTEDIDDIFGGAGVLPSAAPQAQMQPSPAEAPGEKVVSDDLTDLLG